MSSPSGSALVASAPESGPSVELIDAIEAAVLATAGVASLSAGPAGTAATLLPGRRIAGLRIVGERVEVHIAANYGEDLHALADRLHTTLESRYPFSFDVFIDDLVA